MFKKCGPFVPEPGMLCNLDIFGKFAFEIRMDYWYVWKTHFLNFRDFQESPNPLKIPRSQNSKIFKILEWTLGNEDKKPRNLFN